MEREKHYIGVDVSKLYFDVTLEIAGSYHHHRLSNDVEGYQRLIGLMQPGCVYHAVMEASGPYYLRLATYLFEHQVCVSVVNPLVIRRFCQMRLCRAKTDKKDAKMILLYGQTEKPSQWQPEADYMLELRQMQTAIDGLNKHRTDMIRQLEAFSQGQIISKEATSSLNKTIAVIEEQIDLLMEKMQEQTERYHGDMYKRLQSIPGLGKKTVILLITATGAFKKFSHAKQLSAYFGISPRIFESGSSVKGRARITKMGMSKIRTLLYLCAWSAKRWNTPCKELYDRLVAKGKSKRLALIAVANKLLKQAHAIATKEVAYQQ